MEGTPPFIQEIVDPTARYGPSALVKQSEGLGSFLALALTVSAI